MSFVEPEPGDSAPHPESVEPPPVHNQRRFPMAWAILALLFVWMIAGELVSKTTETTSPVDVMALESQLKFAIIGQEFTKAAGKAASEGQKREFVKTFETIEKEAVKGVGKDKQASKLLLVVQKELGKVPDKKALAILKESKTRSDNVFAQIYGPEPVSSAWLQGQRDQLPKTFLGKVVTNHALEKAGAPELRRTFRQDAILVIVAFVGGILTIVLGLIAIIAFLLSYFSGGARPVGHPFRGLTKADGDRLALRFCVFFALLALLPLPLGLVLGKVHWAVSAVVFEVIVLAVFLFACRQPVLDTVDPPSKVVGKTKPWPMLVGLGILTYMANLPIVIVMALIANALLPGLPTPSHPLSDRLAMGADPMTLFFMFVTASVMAPLIEEFSFRGLLFPALTSQMKPVLAILLTGFTFAAIHPQGPAMWAALGTIGAVAAGLTYFTGSLIPAIVMHACHNTAILTLSLVLLY